MANTALPTITGTTVRGNLLTCGDGLWTNIPDSLTRQWMRCDVNGANCTPLSSSTGKTYLLVAADVGSSIRCWVTAFNAAGASEAVLTLKTATITDVAAGVPVLVADPVITGNAVQGQVLTSSNGSWTNSPTKYGHCWQRCNADGTGCVTIAGSQDCTGATPNQTYTLVAADVGKTIKAFTTAYNATGASTAVLSAQTPVIAPSGSPPPPPPSSVLWNGDFEPGNTSQYANPGFASPTRITIVASDGAVVPRQGNRMCRMELRSGDFPNWTTGANAVGLQSPYRATPGLDTYMGWSIYLKSPFVFASWNIFQEWHGNDNFQAAFQQHVVSGRWRFYNHWIPPGHVSGGHSSHDMGAVVLGQWWDFAVRIKWAKDSTGIFEGWSCPAGQVPANNKKFQRNGPTFFTNTTTYVYPQSVIYRPAAGNTVVAYYDAVRVGTTLASVTP